MTTTTVTLATGESADVSHDPYGFSPTHWFVKRNDVTLGWVTKDGRKWTTTTNTHGSTMVSPQAWDSHAAAIASVIRGYHEETPEDVAARRAAAIHRFTEAQQYLREATEAHKEAATALHWAADEFGRAANHLRYLAPEVPA